MRNPIRGVQDMTKYQVNRKDQMEVIRQTFYDSNTAAAAGQTLLTFFALPVGQGTPAKTLADTNMKVGGALPAPFRFLVQAIEIYFLPGGLPGIGPVASAPDPFVNDVYKFLTGAAGGSVFNTPFLELFVGSKAYLDEGIALFRFPPFGRLDGFATFSDQSTIAASQFNKLSYATAAGRPYIIDPPILIEPTQNFAVTMNWPIAVSPISVAGKTSVVLNGVLVRNSQ
jgi:hypothetical protein